MPDPLALYGARRGWPRRWPCGWPGAQRLIDRHAEPGPFTPEARAAGRRALRLSALALQSRLDGGRAAEAVFRQANNMTEEQGALAILLDIGRGRRNWPVRGALAGATGW